MRTASLHKFAADQPSSTRYEYLRSVVIIAANRAASNPLRQGTEHKAAIKKVKMHSAEQGPRFWVAYRPLPAAFSAILISPSHAWNCRCRLLANHALRAGPVTD
jgi:hypothetical protein